MSWEFRLDRRTVFESLEPYFNGQGGLLQILSSCPNTAAREVFLEQVRDRVESSGGLHVRFDPGQDEHTRYPQGIASKLAEKLEVSEVPSHIPVRKGQGATVASDILALGDVHQENIRYEEHHHYHSPINSANSLMDQCRTAMDGMLQKKRSVLLILVPDENMPSETSRWFWREMWAGELEKWLKKGVWILLAGNHHPLPNNLLWEQITLYGELQDADKAHVEEELVRIAGRLQNRSEDDERVIGLAKGFLSGLSSPLTMQELHDRFSIAMQRWGNPTL